MIAIVVAHSANRVIGCDGGLPWRLPGDLRRFRALTLGRTVIMGRRTFESLPAGFRPLPERRNVVVSANPDFRPAGVEVLPTFEAALDAHPDCFVIGGSSIYAQALPRAGRVYATHVEGNADGDAFFPALDPSHWRCVEEQESLVENGHSYVFRTYDRQA